MTLKRMLYNNNTAASLIETKHLQQTVIYRHTRIGRGNRTYTAYFSMKSPDVPEKFTMNLEDSSSEEL